MIVAAGVEAQEYTYLSLEERKALIRRTIEYVGGRCPVMVGISHPSFRTAIELAHFAEAQGAAAVQMLAPLRAHGGPPTERDLVAYFEAVGRETALPITLYLNPGPGAEVSIPATIALAKLDKVRFIKESSRDLAARLAPHRRDRPRRPCPIFHDDADAAGLDPIGRRGRDHAAARPPDRARGHRRLRRRRA